MDTKYNCQRCGYNTEVKAHFIKHLTKKIACLPLLNDIDCSSIVKALSATYEKIHECDKCKKKFSYISGKYRHQKTCNYKEKEESNEELKEQVKNLTRMIEEMKASPSNNTNIVNINQQNNITINLSNFSHERIDYIDREIIKDCLKEMDIIKLLELVHFDPEHPENHTVRVKNVNQNLLEYHLDGKWVIGKKDKVIEDMINCSGYRILKTFYRENKDEIEEEIEDEEDKPDIIIKEINDWLSKINQEDEKLFKELKSNIFLIILNNKAMVCAK